jgi:hypothetical protein
MLLQRQRLRFVFFLGSVILSLGCGKAAHDRIEVQGVVTLDGKPLPSGMIIKFTSQEDGSPVARGATDAEGRYAMYAKPGKIGLLPGKYIVSVELPLADLPGPYTGPPELADIKIPSAYQTEKSSVTFTVPADGPTFDILMTSK